MNYDAWKVALDGLAILISIGTILFAYFRTRTRATGNQLEKLQKQLIDQKDSHDASAGRMKDRIARLEAQIEHMPDKDHVHRTELAIAEMRGDISTMAKTFEAIERTVQRVEGFLMEKSKG